MIAQVKPEDLEEELKRQLQDWTNGELRQQVNKAIKKTAKTGAKMLKEGGPYKDRTGDYSKSWNAKLRRGKYTSVTMTEQYSINAGKQYRLTHLLENGHQSRSGGRVKAYGHIKPVEEYLEVLVISNIHKEVGK